MKFLREQGFEQVGVLGVSQGAASALMAAGRSARVDALVAQSGATSLFGLMRGRGVLSWVPDWEISLICRLALYRLGAASEVVISPRSGPIDVVGEIAPAPILIVHGGADELVSVTEAHALFEAARQPKQLWIVAERGHENLGEHGDYKSRIVSLLSAHLSPPRPSPEP